MKTKLTIITILLAGFASAIAGPWKTVVTHAGTPESRVGFLLPASTTSERFMTLALICKPDGSWEAMIASARRISIKPGLMGIKFDDMPTLFGPFTVADDRTIRLAAPKEFVKALCEKDYVTMVIGWPGKPTVLTGVFDARGLKDAMRSAQLEAQHAEMIDRMGTRMLSP